VCVPPSDPTENVSLKVLSEGVLLEGDNVTLRCVADGNPAPTTFNFFIKVSSQSIVHVTDPRDINQVITTPPSPSPSPSGNAS
jgi:hypothetical protein